MGRPREAIRAAVLTTAIHINARVEADIRAVVVSNDRLGGVLDNLCSGQGILLRVPIDLALVGDFIETIGRVDRRTSPFNWL